MDEVPNPTVGENRSKYDGLYEQIGALKRGQALRVEFGSESHAAYVRGAMRKRAKKDGQFMSSSRDATGLTRYFWLEKA